MPSHLLRCSIRPVSHISHLTSTSRRWDHHSPHHALLRTTVKFHIHCSVHVIGLPRAVTEKYFTWYDRRCAMEAHPILWILILLGNRATIMYICLILEHCWIHDDIYSSLCPNGVLPHDAFDVTVHYGFGYCFENCVGAAWCQRRSIHRGWG